MGGPQAHLERNLVFTTKLRGRGWVRTCLFRAVMEGAIWVRSVRLPPSPLSLSLSLPLPLPVYLWILASSGVDPLAVFGRRDLLNRLAVLTECIIRAETRPSFVQTSEVVLRPGYFGGDGTPAAHTGKGIEERELHGGPNPLKSFDEENGEGGER